MRRTISLALGMAVLLGCDTAAATAPAAHVFRVARVVDGDTVYLTSGAKIRLVQIDTPEVFFGFECWGRQASAETKLLLPPGTRVRLLAEPATDRVDAYGRLLRYVIRAADNVNVNLRLVARGDAAPYFYDGREGRFAATLTRLATRARAEHRGLWGACRSTPVAFERGVDTGPAT
ncbi:MAG: thermonuclease family protein [Actinomycetes bacterium]